MEKEIVLSGRKYLAHVSPDDQNNSGYVIIGPPEGIVDELGLPEPFATNLHNVLYNRHIFTYHDIANMRVAFGVLQEALSIDAQRLAETFARFETDSSGGRND
jgi:hypothetical protein